MPATPATEYRPLTDQSSDTQAALLHMRDVVKRLEAREEALTASYDAGDISTAGAVEYGALYERLRAYRAACWYLEKEQPL